MEKKQFWGCGDITPARNRDRPPPKPQMRAIFCMKVQSG
jgi:hypothetical protein